MLHEAGSKTIPAKQAAVLIFGKERRFGPRFECAIELSLGDGNDIGMERKDWTELSRQPAQSGRIQEIELPPFRLPGGADCLESFNLVLEPLKPLAWIWTAGVVHVSLNEQALCQVEIAFESGRVGRNAKAPWSLATIGRWPFDAAAERTRYWRLRKSEINDGCQTTRCSPRARRDTPARRSHRLKHLDLLSPALR
jgi:hypothetical protein